MGGRLRYTGVVHSERVEDPFDPTTVPVAAPGTPDGAWVAVDGDARRIVAEPGTASAAIWQIAADRGLDPEPPPAVRAEADALHRAPGIDDPALLDLTHLPMCTIDEQTSKDLDQAVCVQADGDGHVVWYAIADAAHFVRPDTALFGDALLRGATYYLPGLVVPMLPAALSEDIVSLNAGVDRRALVFEVHLDGTGRLTRTAVHRARVRSRLKTWFSAVQHYYDGSSPLPGGDPEVGASLDALAEVGRRRLQVAEERHVVALRRREVAVGVGVDGLRFVAQGDLRLDVERYNEQISLLCNVEGARLLAGGDPDTVQPIFRVHEPPVPERLERLTLAIDDLTRRHRLDPARWGWRPGGRSLAEYLASLPEEGPHARIALAIHRQAMLSSGSASFTGTPGRHHGVGADLYARFTAPMREIVGVFVHKEAWERLGAPAGGRQHDEALRDRIIEASQRARSVQRALDGEANRMVLDQLFADDLARSARPRRVGTVMGVASDRVHVQLDAPPIDVKAYLVHVQAQRGEGPLRRTRDELGVARERDGAVLFRVGDAVAVQVIDHDVDRDRWALALHPAG